MRITRYLATVAVVGGLLAPNAAAAPPPPPAPQDCLASLEAALVPANPGNLLVTGAVIVASAQVVCVRDTDPLDQSVNDMATPYGGHTSMQVWTTDTNERLCDFGPKVHTSVGPLLVMPMEIKPLDCDLGVSNPRRTRPLLVILHFATQYPYRCCDTRVVYLSPIPAGVDAG